jgi:hypothetical protein
MPKKPKVPKKSKDLIPAGPRKKRWGLLAYIAGDNNLSDAGLEDIIELCQVGGSDTVHVGVEIDTYGEYTGSLRYEITEPDWTGQAYRTVIDRLSEKDSGDPETLWSFLNWGFGRYPADDHLVVVWNHGAGFRSPRRDIGYDDFGSSLDMPEISGAFRKAGIGPENRISVLGFDACLMNMVEIAHHFRDYADFLVGSQQTEPGDGWPYDEVLKIIKKGPTAKELAEKIVKAYIRCYRKMGIFNVTQSAVECSKTEAAVKALSDLGSAVANLLPGVHRPIKMARLSSQTYEMADYVDLVNLVELIGRRLSDEGVKSAARKAVDAAKDAVIVSETLGETVRKSKGLSVWFPAIDRVYYDYRGKYLALDFAQKYRGWVEFLDAYHA